MVKAVKSNVQLGRVYPFEFDARVHGLTAPFRDWSAALERFAEITCEGELLEGLWRFDVKLMLCEKGMTWEEMVAWARSIGGLGILPGQTAPAFDLQYPEASIHGTVEFAGSCYRWGDRQRVVALIRYETGKRSDPSVLCNDFSAGRGMRYCGYRPLILPVVVAQRKLE